MDFTLAKDWRGEDPTGWFMSEKLNGWRGGWDGAALWSRLGNVFTPGAQWAAALAGRPALDGEIYLGRPDGLDEVGSIIRSGQGWERLKFHVFDGPELEGDFEERQAQLARMPWGGQLVLVPQVRCRGRAHLAEFVAGILAKGGEGVVLREAGSFYETGRSTEYLRIKKRNWARYQAAPVRSLDEMLQIMKTPHYPIKRAKAA